MTRKVNCRMESVTSSIAEVVPALGKGVQRSTSTKQINLKPQHCESLLCLVGPRPASPGAAAWARPRLLVHDTEIHIYI